MSGDPISIPGMISVQLFENSSGEQVEGTTQYTVNRWLVFGGMAPWCCWVVRIMPPHFRRHFFHAGDHLPSTPHTLKPNILCFCDRDLMKIFLPPTINVIYKYKSSRQADTQYPDPDSRQNTPLPPPWPAPPRPAWLVFIQFIQSEACPDFSLARCLL